VTSCRYPEGRPGTRARWVVGSASARAGSPDDASVVRMTSQTSPHGRLRRALASGCSSSPSSASSLTRRGRDLRLPRLSSPPPGGLDVVHHILPTAALTIWQVIGAAVVRLGAARRPRRPSPRAQRARRGPRLGRKLPRASVRSCEPRVGRLRLATTTPFSPARFPRSAPWAKTADRYVIAASRRRGRT
jgi:hypothetical protein